MSRQVEKVDPHALLLRASTEQERYRDLKALFGRGEAWEPRTCPKSGCQTLTSAHCDYSHSHTAVAALNVRRLTGRAIASAV